MKKSILSFFSFILVSFAFAQAGQQSKADSVMPMDLQRQVYIYSLASKYNDPAVSKIALYNILAMTPGNTTVMDSLAVMYLEFGQYASAALISQDILQLNPNDMFAAEIAAISFETLGVKDRALTFYEKIYLKRNDLGSLYQVAFLQYDLKRFNEAVVNVDILIGDKSAATTNMLFPTPSNDGQQEISMLAAAYRLKGLIAEAQGKTNEAKQHYTKALEVAPKFEIVSTKLKELK